METQVWQKEKTQDTPYTGTDTLSHRYLLTKRVMRILSMFGNVTGTGKTGEETEF